MSLTVIVPSRGRPGNARRLAGAFRATADPGFTVLQFAVDADDPVLPGYQSLKADYPETGLTVMPERLRIGPIVNAVARGLAPQCDYVGFMGDDHLPRTTGWDRLLTAELEGAPGVAYGNDLFQQERLPTACVLSAVLVRALGYFCPPPLAHLYLDDFWLTLGGATRLAYLPAVIIEHLHPAAGKAGMDDGYAFSMSPGTDTADRQAWEAFCRDQWPADLARLREALSPA